MSDFAPVFLPAGRELNKRVSQTMLRKTNACRRSGFLYQSTKGSAQTVEMVRGSAFHAAIERCIKAMIGQREGYMPHGLAKAVLDEVLAEFPVPIEEHDGMREAIFRWADEIAVEAAGVIACETLFVLEVDGWQVRCKVDFAEWSGQDEITVTDWKSGRGAPNYDEISRKRTDGTISARNFQLILYALALVFGRRVRVARCGACIHMPSPGRLIEPDGSKEQECPHCNGTTRVEIVEETTSPASNAQHVIAEFVYPAIEDSEGKMLRRPMTLTRLELEEYMGSLKAILANLAHCEEAGDWPAVVSDAACGECPCSAMCPIPAELRDFRGRINTMEELQTEAQRYYVEGLHRDAARRELKLAAKALGGPRARVRYGLDRVWEIGDLRESVEIRDKDGMFYAMEEALNAGTPFEREAFVKANRTTPFVDRALSEAELAEEAGNG